MAYKPSQRAVPASILTHAGWMTGLFHVPEKSRFVDSLNRKGEFLRLTDVAMPGRFERLPFFAMQRDAILAVVPDEAAADVVHLETQGYTAHRVSFLLEAGVVEGSVSLLSNVRVSDYFAHRDDFVVLHDVTLRLSRPGETVTPQATKRILVNAKSVIGLTDQPTAES